MGDIARPCPGTWTRWGEVDGGSWDALRSPGGASWAIDREALGNLLCDLARDAGVEIGEQATDRADWTLLARGQMDPAGSRVEPDDRLIGLMMVGEVDDRVQDARLHLETTPEGWTYAILGPQGRLCLALITDASALAGRRPDALMADALDATRRIGTMAAALRQPSRVSAGPIVCGWRPLRAGPSIIRVGDAQASFDPISGRGLWQALRTAEGVAVALDSDGGVGLGRWEEISRLAYDDHRRVRARYYFQGAGPLPGGFWTRRAGR